MEGGRRSGIALHLFELKGNLLRMDLHLLDKTGALCWRRACQVDEHVPFGTKLYHFQVADILRFRP